MRHTAATILIHEKVDVRTVQAICGHAKIETTMNYAHLVSGAIESVAGTHFVGINEKEKEGTEK